MHYLLSNGTSGPSFISTIGPILSGVAELLIALGAGIGFLVRIRRNAKRERMRAEAAASLASQETKKTLEIKLERQHSDQIEQYKTQLVEQHAQFKAQAEAVEQQHAYQVQQLNAQIIDLQKVNSQLLDKILEEHS